jgi:hypothetical protein
MDDTNFDPSELSKHPSQTMEAGVFFSISINAINSIQDNPRSGGERPALVSVVFSVIALEAFINEMTEFAQNLTLPKTPEVIVFIQMMGEADHTSLEFRLQLAHWILTGRLMDKGSQPYQDFALLISLRNDLVHTRPNDLFTQGVSTNEEVHKRLVTKFRSKNILADEDEPSGSWTYLVQTRAVAEWSARTVAAVVAEVCSGTSKSGFQKVLTGIKEQFQGYISQIIGYRKV